MSRGGRLTEATPAPRIGPSEGEARPDIDSSILFEWAWMTQSFLPSQISAMILNIPTMKLTTTRQ